MKLRHMNKRLYLPGLLSVFLLGTGVSCKDKDKDIKKSYCTQNPSECPNIQGVKDYFLFKEGSWWVYEEETSHERDSVYVTESINNTSNYDFDMRLYSTRQDYFYHYWPDYASGNNSCSQSGSIHTRCVLINVSKGKPGDYVGDGDCFFYTFKQGDYETTFNTQFPNNKIIVEQVYQSYILGPLAFAKTVKIHELNTFIEGVQPTNHYYSEGVGIIRKEFLDSNQVWNLVSYHIAP